jgi:hypothetical protein
VIERALFWREPVVEPLDAAPPFFLACPELPLPLAP